MPAPYASPNPDNYFIGKGNVYTKLVDADDSTYLHIGNCPKFEVTPKPEIKEHYSSMEGTKVLDKVAIVARNADVGITVEEFTGPNLLIGLGAVLQSDGSYFLLAASSIERAVKLVGTNDFGAHVQLILPRVFFNISKAISFIGDDWMNFDLEGKALFYQLSPSTPLVKTFMQQKFI